MQRYICIHTFGPNAFTREQIQQGSLASQQTPGIHGLQSFVNLSEGKAVCILEAESKTTLADFFKSMGMPVDTIVPVEVEGIEGVMHTVTPEAGIGLSA